MAPKSPHQGCTLPNPGPSMEARHPLQKPVARWECGWNSGGSCAFREAALRVVQLFISLLEGDSKKKIIVSNKKRFNGEYGSDPEERPPNLKRPEDYEPGALPCLLQVCAQVSPCRRLSGAAPHPFPHSLSLRCSVFSLLCRLTYYSWIYCFIVSLLLFHCRRRLWCSLPCPRSLEQGCIPYTGSQRVGHD